MASETLKFYIEQSSEQCRFDKGEFIDHGVNILIDSAHFEYYRSDFDLDYTSDLDEGLNELFAEAKEDGWY